MNKIIIGKRIRYERQKVDLTLDELGAQIGVSKQCLSGWEHGRNMPDVISLYRLSKIFSISIEDFLHDIDKSPSLPFTRNHYNHLNIPSPHLSARDCSPAISPKEIQLIYKLRKLTPEKRKAVELLFGIRNTSVVRDH